MRHAANAESAIQNAMSALEDEMLESIIFAQTRNDAWKAIHKVQNIYKIQKKLSAVILEIERLDQ